jgi:hypothetical protein
VGDEGEIEHALRDLLIAEAPALARAMAPKIVKQFALDLMKALAGGELLTISQAAEIAQVGNEAMRKRCVDLEDVGAPIAIRISGTWLVIRSLLLENIKQRKDDHEYLAALDRAKNLAKVGSSQLSGRFK